jgi:DNA/RNA endonuclease G (NUC1)
MNFRIPSAALVVLTVAIGSCSDNRVLAPVVTSLLSHPSVAEPNFVTAPTDGVRINELHYDNAGTDAGERVEISGPAGTDLAGWKIVLYNGSGGAAYGTLPLSGVITAQCSTRGTVVVDALGLQNGNPDGLALVKPGDATNPDGIVVEFLSYGGTSTAVGGVANGLISDDIGVREGSSTPIGHSLQRNGDGGWSAGPNTFENCNGLREFPIVTTVTVEPATATIAHGAIQPFTAAGFDAANQPVSNVAFTWTSSSTTIAAVDAAGQATGLQPGEATITATTPGGASGTATLRVDESTVPPPESTPVRISELHYDNAGTDVGEAVEVEGPAGTNLAGWSIALYNGNGGAQYGTLLLSGTITNMCNGRGVISIPGPSGGIQNGSPDGLALVNASGTVVEFLSYEGSFTATNGPASGRVSTEIPVNENPDNSVAAGQSLQRDASGEWYGPEEQSLGACNSRPILSTATIAINELMTDPVRAPGGASWGEWFEVYNYGAQPTDLRNWTIISNGQLNHVIASSVVVPANGFAVLGRGADLALNGGVRLDYNYFTGSATTLFLDASDRLELRDASGARVDLVRWTGLASGVTRAVRDASLDNFDAAGSSWGYSTVPFGEGDFGTPGAANGTLSTTVPLLPNFLSFTGRTPSDVPLPVGFQDQIFATLRNGSTGATIPAMFTWNSETPGIASIDERGVITAHEPGTARFRATANDGTTRTYALPTRVAVASTSAQYQGNTEFGTPTDNNASDDFIVHYPQYTASFNRNRGTPNWVSYDLEASHFGPEDRCDCFTFDPALPASLSRYTTADYTGAGMFHGYGIDRGHLVRSFDRTSASLDNAFTFYFTNIIPQAADNNQGPWAAMENHLGDLARFQSKEIYVIAGVAGSKGTVKDEGKITIPAYVWKVGVVMPRDQGLANVNDYRDLDVIAAIMPNEPGIRNVDWTSYITTVDAVEALSGYDILALLPDPVEVAVESELKAAILLVERLLPSGGTLAGDGKWLINKLELAT